MAKTITRIPLTLFGNAGASTNFGQFGSQLAGTPVKTKDVALLQSLAAWANGWQNAVASGNTPYLEDLNSIFYVHAYMQAYMLQEGIPEYDASTPYFIGSIAKRPSSPEMYISLTDSNTGNALPTAGTSNTNWQFLYGLIGGIFRVGGPLAMNSQKITGLANGTAPTDAAAFGQVPTLPVSISNGGTNASASLANSAVMVSKNNAIVESASLTQGVLGNSPGTTYNPLMMVSAGTIGFYQQNTAGIGTSFVTIMNISQTSCFVIVSGNLAGMGTFCDIIVASYLSGFTVLSSTTSGAPARTYQSGGIGIIQMKMASGATTGVSVFGIGLSS